MAAMTPPLEAVERQAPSTVLVTGATGYIAATLVQRLLAAGHTVHGTVRDVAKATAELSVLPGASERLKLFKADLLKPDGFKEAMQGCTVVFHTASPVSVGGVYGPQAQRELVEPAVQGTESVLRVADEVGSVRRVVLTSSVAAMVHSVLGKPPGHVITEAEWNTESTLWDQPYALSKMLAEKKAWEIANAQRRWDLVAIAPAVVMGPPATARSAGSESVSVLRKVLRGGYSFLCPTIALGIVDVRDVAKAHVLAAFTPSASGRFIVAPQTVRMRDLVALAAELFPKQVRPPLLPLPKWLALIIGPLLGVGRDLVRARFNAFPRYSVERAKAQLGMTFLPLQDTVRDTMLALTALGLRP